MMVDGAEHGRFVDWLDARATHHHGARSEVQLKNSASRSASAARELLILKIE
jgi:hypothetical protein